MLLVSPFEKIFQGMIDDQRWSVIVEAPGRLFELRADQRRPAASLIKLAVVNQALGNLDLAEQILVTDLPETRYPSILPAIGKIITIEQACAISLMTSDNAAASWLINRLGGPQEITRTMHQEGLTDSLLVCGFDDQDLIRGKTDHNLISARDAKAMLEKAAQGPAKQWLLNNLSNSRIPALLPSDLPILHKTGTLNGAVHGIAIIYDDRCWSLTLLSENQSQAAHSSLKMAELTVAVRQQLLEQGMIEARP